MELYTIMRYYRKNKNEVRVLRALTKKEVLEIIKQRPENAFYCPECFYVLEKIPSDEGARLTCHSVVCENGESYYNIKTGDFVE